MKKIVSIFLTLVMLITLNQTAIVGAKSLLAETEVQILTDSTERRVVVESNAQVLDLILYVAAYNDDTMLDVVSQEIDLHIGRNEFEVEPTWEKGTCEYVKIFVWDKNHVPYAEKLLILKPTIVVENAYADFSNDTVKVDVSVLNNPGIASLKMNVAYDSEIILTNIEFNEAFGAYVTAPEPYANPQPISLISPLSDIYAEGTLATLTFDISNVSEGKEYADVFVTCDNENTFNGTFEEVVFKEINGKIVFDTNAILQGFNEEENVSLMSVEEPLTLTISNGVTMPGETVKINVDVANNPGISSLKVDIAYDEVLALQNVELSTAFGPYVTTPEPYENPQSISLISPLSEIDVNGTLATLTFLVSEEVEDGYEANINASFDEDNIFDSEFNLIDLNIVNGKVNIFDGIPGDINGDGKVNNQDAILLFRHVAGWNVMVIETALDVTGDGKVNNQDAILLFRYIAGWDVEIGAGKVCAHELTAIAEKAATCTVDGNTQYWHCSKCDKYFADAKAKEVIKLTDTVIVATGHTEVAVPGYAPTMEKEGLTDGIKCSVCNEWISEQKAIDKLLPKQHSITYIINAGDYIDQGDAYLQAQTIENPNPITYSENELVELKKLSTPGYTFDGWVDQKGARWDVIPKGTTQELVLYAKWTQNVYTVTFDTPDVDVSYTWYDSKLGENVTLKNAAKYTIDTGLTLTNPEAYKYTFVGWSNDDGFIVSEIKPGTTGNITLRANWTSDRNRATSYSNYGDPIIIEDYDRRQFLFVYDIGKIDNVPLYTYKKSNGEEIRYSNTTVDFTSTATLKTEFGREDAQNIAKTVANATTRSSGWTLSEEWNQGFSSSQENKDKLIQSEKRTDSKGNTVGGKYFVSNSEGGSSYSSVESGSSSSSSAKVTTEDSFGINTSYDKSTEKYANAELSAGIKNETEVSAGVSVPVKFVDISAGVKNTTTVSADAKVSSGRKDNTAFHVDTNSSSYVGTDIQSSNSSHYNAVNSSSTNWNSNEGYEKSSEMSQETTVSEAIAKEIESTTTYNISKALSGAKENTESVSGTTSEETGYSNSVTVSEYFMEENVYAESHKDDHVGYHRLVEAGIVHVYGVVGYDIATESYYTYTFNVLEDDTYAYWDYSLKDPSFTDCENGLVTFEIPYEVNKYIAGVTGQTEGLEIDVDDDGFGYVKGFETPDNLDDDEYVDVVVPQYFGIDNLDGTADAVIVTGFNASAFKGNKKIRTIILPMYVTEIPDYAFEGCTNLETVIAYGVTKIGAYAFKDCENLGKFVNSNGETEFSAFMVDNLVTELGEGAFSGVNEIKVMAYDSAVADSAIASGAKKITVDLTKLVDDYSGTKDIESCTEYFGIIGGGKTFNGLKIKSDAKETLISNMTLCDNTDIPLEISSETVSLLRVTVNNAPGLALRLSAENTNLKLYRTVTLTSNSENSILSKNVTLSKANSSITGTLDFSGKYLACGEIQNTSMLKYPENVIKITNEEYANYSSMVTVLFDTDGGNAIDSQTISYSAKVAKPADPVKDRYKFLGWYADSALTTAWNFDAPVTENITLYAAWKLNEFIITFDASGGSCSTASKTVYAGEKIGSLPTPARAHYTFLGWYTSAGSQYTTDTTYNENVNITLVAKWQINEYTVTFHGNGGSPETTTQKVVAWGKATPPSAWRDYYNHTGWYTNAACTSWWDVNSQITGNIDLYAGWTLKDVSGWIKDSDMPAGAQEVESKYTYSETFKTTSTTYPLSGWTKYDEKTTYGNWGSWSSWSDTKRTGSDTRQVETRTVYNYYRYASSYNASTGSPTKTSSCPNKYTYKIVDKLSATNTGNDGYKLWHDSNGDYNASGSNYHSVWKCDTFETTQYRYRDRSKTVTYYYEKTENKESSGYPSSSGGTVSNVQRWVRYRAK